MARFARIFTLILVLLVAQSKTGVISPDRQLVNRHFSLPPLKNVLWAKYKFLTNFPFG